MGKAKTRYVVICTEKKGVFMGLARQVDLDRLGADCTKLRLKDAQMCVYWSRDVRGILGLGVSGPTTSCRITPVVDELECLDVHEWNSCSDEAVKKWRDQPWG